MAIVIEIICRSKQRIFVPQVAVSLKKAIVVFVYLRYAGDIASALSYIHSRSIVHLDVKPANVIVSLFNDRCKLTDFGCSICLDSSSSTILDPSTTSSSGDVSPLRTRSTPATGSHAASGQLATPTITGTSSCPRVASASAAAAAAVGRSDAPGGCGTLQYRAPELLSPATRSSPVGCRADSDRRLYKADVYSLGVTLWQLAARRTPYAGLFDSPMAVAYNVVKYRARPDGTTTSPFMKPDESHFANGDRAGDQRPELDYREIYVRCWDADAATRPHADELARIFGAWRLRRTPSIGDDARCAMQCIWAGSG